MNNTNACSTCFTYLQIIYFVQRKYTILIMHSFNTPTQKKKKIIYLWLKNELIFTWQFTNCENFERDWQDLESISKGWKGLRVLWKDWEEIIEVSKDW